MEDGEIRNNKVTASSEQSANTPAKNGRLNYIAGSSWCAGTSDTNPYLQINLRTLHIICAVSTQGNSQADQWVTNYTLQLSTDGTTWTDYKEGGQVMVLRGNNDRATSVKHVIYEVLTRYLRFLPQTHQGGVCMRTEVFGVVKQQRVCEMEAIGLASGGAIPDSSFTASTFFSNGYKPSYGRLNGSSRGWAPKTKTNPTDYLQIDLLQNYVICAVATQGANGIDEWTKNYKIQLSLDGTTFFTYKENNIDRVFPGNSNQNNITLNSLKEFSRAKFIRFQPTTYSGWKVLRVEVYGTVLRKVCESEAIGLASGGKIPDSSFTASTFFGSEYKPSYGRLNGSSRGWAPKTTTNPADYLQIDLLYEYVICAVATQGANGINEWTKNYKIQLSLDGTTFFTYKENTIDRVFSGNSNQSGIIKNSLHEFASAKFIRFQPTAYSSWKDLRVEVYGILLTKVPSQPPAAFKLTASSSTSITASWRLPPVLARHGRNITGFKLFYKEKSAVGPATTLPINSGSTLLQNVTGLDKYTEYEFQVLAFTSDGDGPKSCVEVTRTKEDVPSGPPSNFTLTASSSTSVTAFWQLPPADSRNGIIIGFKFFYQRKSFGGPATITTINNGTTTVRDITGLVKYTEYEFQMLAFTSVGDGPKSSLRNERTKEDVPSQPPRNFSVISRSSTSVRVSWQLPSVGSRHGIVRGFKLYYKKRGSSGLPYTLPIRNETIDSKDVTGLDKYTDYEFQVLAFTSVGDGPKSSVEIARTKEDVPTRAPSNFSLTASNSTSITASWQLPPADSRNGIITGFKLFFKKRGSSGLPATLAMGNEQTRFKHVTGLDKYSEYEFQVLAFTSIGDGPRSAVTVERTMEDAPSKAPESFTVTVLSSTSVTAHWQLPPADSRNGIIAGFKLYYKKDSGGSAAIITLNNGTIYSEDITGLDKYTEYEFQVLAFTSVGDGPKSSLILAKTIEDVPSESPGNLTLTASSSTSIAASWQLPSADSRNGIIVGFRLFYKRKSSRELATIITINNGTITARDITGLVKYTEYEFQMLAFTSVGDGPNSSLEIMKTREDVPSKPPRNFSVTASSSTSITASWELPPAECRNGVIIGFKLLYKKKGSSGSASAITISNETIHTEDITGLDKYTEYEFQVLAFTSVGDGPKSSLRVERTMEDAPSKAPVDFSVTASSSTSITLSWKPPPENATRGIVTGFKLFYKRSFAGSATTITINSGASLSRDVTELDIYTEYEFQVLAFTSVGDGPRSAVEVERTMEDAPSAPLSFGYEEVAPNKTHGPRMNLTWSKPAEANGIIRSYTIFYANKDGETKRSIGGDAFSYLVDVLGGVTYHFYIRAVTIKPGQNTSFSVKTKEYEPSRGPENVISLEVKRTEYQITWDGLPREVANGFIKTYQVRLLLKESCSPVDASFNSTFNTTKTEMLLSSVSVCARYEVSVRAFTAAGPGPYSEPSVIQTQGEVWSHEKPSPPAFTTNSSDGGITAKITLPNFTGHANFFQVIVITYRSDYNGVVNPPADFTTRDLMTYEEAHKSPLPAAYVTFQFGGHDFYKYQVFTVGDRVQSSSKIRSKRSNGEENYYNKPLQPNTNYRVFLRAFVSETLYSSSTFIALKTKDKPVVKELPDKTTVIVGEKVVLTCEASGDPQPSVRWSKDGDTSIPRANFNNDGLILIIREVIPRDSGIYECTASNTFGVTHAATTLIVDDKQNNFLDKQSNFPVAVIVVLCVVLPLLVVIGGVACKLKNRRAGAQLINRTKELNRIISDDMGPPDSSHEQLASSPASYLQLHSMTSEGNSPGFPDSQVVQFENKAFDPQSVNSEK
ncbi:protein sidekick-2-like isoform X2 [Stylophora pistillata]|nr:protein sidekick-2-like isoform X2 [Stylophora pistillata]XP_022783221.1 protein sidekick-2-like isoform X2 [Stylophora pistillata]